MTLNDEIAKIEQFIGKRSGANMVTKGEWLCEHGPHLVAALRLATRFLQRERESVATWIKLSDLSGADQSDYRGMAEAEWDEQDAAILRTLRGEI